MLSTFVFCVLCFGGAWLVWLHRPGSSAGLNDYGWLIALLLPGLVAILFFVGQNEGHGRQLSLTIGELRIPLQDAERDGTYFIVGPRAEKSDFVVGPYYDLQQSREAYRDAFDGLLSVRRKDGRWQYCGKRVAPDVAANLPGMEVAVDGATLQGCRDIVSAPSTVSINRLDADADPVTRRSFKISLSDNHVHIALPAAEALTRHVGKCDGAGSADVLRLAPAGMHNPDRGYRVPDNLVFDQLGQGGVHKFLAPDKLGALSKQPFDNQAAAPWKLSELCNNGPQIINWPADDQDSRLIISTRTTSLAWWIIGLLFVASFWTWRLCHQHWREGPGRIEASLVLALQWLLALRLVIAQQGLFNNDSLIQANILWSPALAFVSLPLLAVALLRSGDAASPGSMLRLALQIPVVAAIACWGLDWQLPGMQETGLAIGAIGLLAWRGYSRSDAPLLVRALDFARPLAVKSLERARGLKWFSAARIDSWNAGIALVVLLITVRGSLAGMGRLISPAKPLFQESLNGIPLVGRLPLSMLYAPLAIVAMGLMITGYRAAPSLARAFFLSAAFGGLFIGIGALVRDFGMIWIFAWPVGWAIAALLVVKPGEGRLKDGLARLFLIGPLLSPLILAGGFYLLKVGDIPSPRSDLGGHMEAASKWDRNVARLQRYIDPYPLADAGSSASFEMLQQAAQLEPLTGQMIGKGYLAPSGVVAPLLGYQYSDNLLAVQIAWPFGRLGLAVWLLALLWIMIALWRRRSGPPASSGWRDESARLAAMTFFWSGAYMALANLNIVPFTGRNAYLLAADSTGDLAEGFILLLLVVLPLLVDATRAPEGRS